MGLSIRTAHGKDFWRCGIKFGAEPIVVPTAKLREPFGVQPTVKPENPQKKVEPVCVGDVLVKDRMLVCVEAPDPKDPEAEKPDAADKGGKSEKADLAEKPEKKK